MKQAPTTYLRKDFRGSWTATTEIELENNRVLEVKTYKSNGRLATSASVGRLEDGFISHTLYVDYATRLHTSDKRCTSKNVEAQHVNELAKLDTILNDIKAHNSRVKNEN